MDAATALRRIAERIRKQGGFPPEPPPWLRSDDPTAHSSQDPELRSPRADAEV